MDNKEFQQILFMTAVYSMACDGEIHEKEIKALKEIISETPYFKDIDTENLLKENVEKIKESGKEVLKEYFDLLKNQDFNPSEEMLILEVMIRIIQADLKLDENEERFIYFVRRSLAVTDEIIKYRFGNRRYLFLSEYDSLGNIKEKELSLDKTGVINVDYSTLTLENIEEIDKSD